MQTSFDRLQSLELEARNFGFYWENTSQIIQQIVSELKEIQTCLSENKNNKDLLQEEIGDLLHASFSLCIYCQLQPAETLHLAINKFEKRFKTLQIIAHQEGLPDLKDVSFNQITQLWRKVKHILAQNHIPTHPNQDKTAFFLDPGLANSCLTLVDWPLCRVLLKNHETYPWCILVPRRQNIREITDLNQTDQRQLMHEISLLTQAIQEIFEPDKVNLGALGNIVTQFHFHIVGRYKTDPLWPAGIWQHANKDVPYKNADLVVEKLKKRLIHLIAK